MAWKRTCEYLWGWCDQSLYPAIATRCLHLVARYRGIQHVGVAYVPMQI